jgi:hypothetical protein
MSYFIFLSCAVWPWTGSLNHSPPWKSNSCWTSQTIHRLHRNATARTLLKTIAVDTVMHYCVPAQHTWDPQQISYDACPRFRLKDTFEFKLLWRIIWTSFPREDENVIAWRYQMTPVASDSRPTISIVRRVHLSRRWVSRTRTKYVSLQIFIEWRTPPPPPAYRKVSYIQVGHSGNSKLTNVVPSSPSSRI